MAEDKSTISRGTFLKGGLMAGAAVAIGPSLVDKINSTKNPEPPQLDRIEVDKPWGTFVPIYEHHGVPMDAKQFEEIASDTTIYFLEGVIQSNNALASSQKQEIESKRIGEGGALLDESTKQYQEIDQSIIDLLVEKHTLVSSEGFAIPDDIMSATEGAKLLEAFSGLAFLGASGINLAGKTLAKEKATKADYAGVWAGYAAAGWGTLPVLLEAYIENFVAEVKNTGSARAIQRIHGILSDLHPERPILFFRNLVNARKMMVLSKEFSKKDAKQVIAYKFGLAHSGLEDVLNAGPAYSLIAIGAFPKQFLQTIVDYNGGIESFCTIGVADPAKVYSQGDMPLDRVVDQELKSLLEEKLSK